MKPIAFDIPMDLILAHDAGCACCCPAFEDDENTYLEHMSGCACVCDGTAFGPLARAKLDARKRKAEARRITEAS